MVSEFFAVAEGACHTFSLHAKLHMYQAADAEEETDYNYLDAADEVEDDKPSGKMCKGIELHTHTLISKVGMKDL